MGRWTDGKMDRWHANGRRQYYGRMGKGGEGGEGVVVVLRLVLKLEGRGGGGYRDTGFSDMK